MSATSPAEWATYAGIGVAAYAPGALVILALDHDLARPVAAAGRVVAGAAERAAGRARLQAAGLLLVLATYLVPQEAAR